jgi:hypothetical protein
MDQKINQLIYWGKNENNLTSDVCCEKLGITYKQFYYICDKHKIPYTKRVSKKGGKKFGSQDKFPRIRREKKFIKTGGNIDVLNIDEFLQEQNKILNTKITKDNVELFRNCGSTKN